MSYEMVSCKFHYRLFRSSVQAPWHKPGQNLPVDWPSKGHIEFDDLCLRYRPGLDLVLRGVNFKVQPGEKVCEANRYRGMVNLGNHHTVRLIFSHYNAVNILPQY